MKPQDAVAIATKSCFKFSFRKVFRGKKIFKDIFLKKLFN